MAHLSMAVRHQKYYRREWK